MADAEKKTINRLKRLFDAYRETHTKGGELLEEINRLLNGEQGIADKLRALEHQLSLTWEARYHSPYLWNYVRDRAQMKKLLKTLEPAEIAARWLSYLKDNDPFYVRSRHSFGFFAGNVNRFAGEAPAELQLDVDAPADCRHTPRCSSDQEHTRKRQSELRA